MSGRSEIADGMRIDRDVPIEMDDGLVLRADVYRPIEDGEYPVILTYGPYAKNMTFQVLYADQWRAMILEHPEIAEGSTCKYQSWEVVDPEKWVPDGYACVRVDSRGAGRSPGYSISSPHVRPRISTTASSGPGRSPGVTARLDSTAFPITRSTSGRLLASSRRISRRRVHGRARPTHTGIDIATVAS